LLTGDKDLLDLKKFYKTKIRTAYNFIDEVKKG
jgi:predicted nucleic acid-binding protein